MSSRLHLVHVKNVSTFRVSIDHIFLIQGERLLDIMKFLWEITKLCVFVNLTGKQRY